MPRAMLPERPINSIARRHRELAVNARISLVNILTASLDAPLGLACEMPSPELARQLQRDLRIFRRNFPDTAYQDFNIVIPPQAPNFVWLVPTKLDGGKEPEPQEESPDA